MNESTKFKKGMRLICARAFKFDLVSVLSILMYMFFMGASAFLREDVGHEDYWISSVFTAAGTACAVSVAAFKTYDIFVARYFRSSPYYKQIYIKCKPLVNIIFGLVFSAVTVITNLITAQLGFISAATLPDMLIFTAVGAGVTVLINSFSYYGFLLVFGIIGISSLAETISGSFFRNGFGFDMAGAAVIAAVIFIVCSAASFAAAKIAYRKRNTTAINNTAKLINGAKPV